MGKPGVRPAAAGKGASLLAAVALATGACGCAREDHGHKPDRAKWWRKLLSVAAAPIAASRSDGASAKEHSVLEPLQGDQLAAAQ